MARGMNWHFVWISAQFSSHQDPIQLIWDLARDLEAWPCLAMRGAKICGCFYERILSQHLSVQNPSNKPSQHILIAHSFHPRLNRKLSAPTGAASAWWLPPREWPVRTPPEGKGAEIVRPKQSQALFMPLSWYTFLDAPPRAIEGPIPLRSSPAFSMLPLLFPWPPPTMGGSK